jgi:predicted nucleic acid-binding protein
MAVGGRSIAANATLVVSGDADLLAIGKHQHIEIVNAAEAVRRIVAMTT